VNQNSPATAIVDTHRHLIGPATSARMAEVGIYDPGRPLPQATDIDLFLHEDFVDQEVSVQRQRAGGVTTAVVSSGGQVEFQARDVWRMAPSEAVKRILEDRLALRELYPDDVEIMVDVDPFDERCAVTAIEALERHDAKAISVASSWGVGGERRFLDDPDATWLWELSSDRDIPVHIHPPLVPIGHEAQVEFRLMEAIGRPFDTTMTAARLICAGVLDRFPHLRLIAVHMGGALAPVIGRLGFGWRLNYEGMPDHGRALRNQRHPEEYLRSNFWVDVVGFSPGGIRHAMSVFGDDRVMFGSDYGPVPISPREHVDLVRGLGLEAAQEAAILAGNADRLFGLGLTAGAPLLDGSEPVTR